MPRAGPCPLRAELQQLWQRNGHKLAVIVPYRDRPKMLETFLPAVSNFLKARPDWLAEPDLGFRVWRLGFRV